MAFGDSIGMGWDGGGGLAGGGILREGITYADDVENKVQTLPLACL